MNKANQYGKETYSLYPDEIECKTCNGLGYTYVTTSEKPTRDTCYMCSGKGAIKLESIFDIMDKTEKETK